MHPSGGPSVLATRHLSRRPRPPTGQLDRSRPEGTPGQPKLVLGLGSQTILAVTYTPPFGRTIYVPTGWYWWSAAPAFRRSRPLQAPPYHPAPRDIRFPSTKRLASAPQPLHHAPGRVAFVVARMGHGKRPHQMAQLQSRGPIPSPEAGRFGGRYKPRCPDVKSPRRPHLLSAGA